MSAEPDLVRAILLVRTGHETTDDAGTLHQARSLFNAVRRAKTDVAAAHVLHDGTCTYAINAATNLDPARRAYWEGVRDTVCGPNGSKHLQWISEQKYFIDCRNEGKNR